MVMDWDKLRIFYAVAEVGSFTHASDVLYISQSAISRHIQALERSFNTPLFHRHARGLVLTGAGQILFETVRQIYGRLEHTKARISDNTDRPKGPLCITTTFAFGTTWLTPRIREFIEAYPEIDVKLLLNDRPLDIAMGESDVAIRFEEPSEGDLISRRLMPLSFHLYANDDYIKRKGLIKDMNDLDNHDLIAITDMNPLSLNHRNWFLHAENDDSHPRRPILSVDNMYGIYRAVRSGLGVGSLPDYLDAPETGLRRAFPDEKGMSAETYFVYPVELRNTKRIEVFKEFMLKKAKEFQ